MELTPQLLTDEIDFRVAVRGYDRHEVDDFLERVAVAVGQLQEQLTRVVARAKAAEARVAELEAGGRADVSAPVDEGAESGSAPEPEVEAAVTPEPERAVASAEPAAVVTDDESLGDELRRTLVLAQRTADMAVAEAREEADRIVAEARAEAERRRAEDEAERERAREEARGRLVEEIRTLEETRASLREDATVLERHLGTERAWVRETIQILRRLVDDPESFRAGPPPEFSAVSLPRKLEPVRPPIVVPPVDVDSEPSIDTDTTSGDVTGPGSTSGDEVEAVDEPVGSDDDAAPTGVVTDDATAVGGEVSASSDGSGDEEDAGADPADTEVVATDGESDTGSQPHGVTTPPPRAPLPERGRTGTASSSAPVHAEEDDGPGRLFSTAEHQRDWRTPEGRRGDQGPHTQPVAVARIEEESDEAFLAELRRAMDDDEPLGPDDAD